MAIDTRDKRASVFARFGFWIPPIPDGTIDKNDRRHLLGFYRGYEAGEPEAAPIPIPDAETGGSMAETCLSTLEAGGSMAGTCLTTLEAGGSMAETCLSTLEAGASMAETCLSTLENGAPIPTS